MNAQSIDTGNVGHKRQDEDKQDFLKNTTQKTKKVMHIKLVYDTSFLST